MEENSELEEGEDWCYKNDDDDKNNIDPDVALSYIDEKIHNVLGHFQKEFEGGYSAENLGSKFGGYGSFLPAYERSPSVGSRPKTSYSSPCIPKSSNCFPEEGGSQSLTALSNAPSSLRRVTAYHSANEHHNSAVASQDVSCKLGSNLASVLAPNSSTKNETSNKSGNLSDKRTLKVRIKVGSDNRVQKVAAIYSGLGLDNSLSSSLGNNTEESGGVLSVSKAIDSPTSILRVMTSFPVPGCALISPLHDSFLFLTRREENSKETRPLFNKGSQEHSRLSGNKLATDVGNWELPKEEAQLPRKSKKAAELRQANGIIYENDTLIPVDQNIENGNAKGNVVKDRLLFGEYVKEGSSVSTLSQNNGRNEQTNYQSSSVENVLELNAVKCDKDANVGLRSGGKFKTSKSSAPSKAVSSVSKCKEDVIVGSVAPSKQKILKQATSYVHHEATMSSGNEKLLFGIKKKSQCIRKSKSAADTSTKECLRTGLSPELRDKRAHGVSLTKDKIHKQKSQKRIINVRDNQRDYLDTKSDQLADWQRLLGDRARDSCPDDIPREQSVSTNKSKENFSRKILDSRPTSGPPAKDVADEGPVKSVADPPVTENAVTSEVDPKDHWAECDGCEKWRMLLCCVKPEDLPDKWLCSMMDWLPGLNRCDISEEETTNATTLLNQQHSLENHGNKISSGATPVYLQHLEKNCQAIDSHALSCSEKRNGSLKESAKPGSTQGLIQTLNITKNHFKESVKGFPPGANAVNTFRLRHSVKSPSLVAEKNTPKLDDHMNRGARVQQIKKKNKRMADQNGYESSKKSKRKKELYHVDKHQDSNMGTGMVGPTLKSNLATKASGKNMMTSSKQMEGRKCHRKDSLPDSAKRLEGQAGVSTNGEYLDIRTGNGENASVKKRKLLECQDKQNDVHVEEISENGFKKVEKAKASKSALKDSVRINATDKLNQNGKAAHIFLSGSEDQADGMEDSRTVGKDKQPTTHRRNIVCERTLDGMDSLREDFVSGQVSGTATSSSSKVSGSLIFKAMVTDVRGLPVESVSSSPLRNPQPEKLTSSAKVMNGDLSIVGSRRCWEGEGNGEINCSIIEKKEKVSGSSYSEPLKFSPFLDRDSHLRSCLRAKSSLDRNHKSCNDLLPTENFCDVDIIGNRYIDAMVPKKSGKSLSLRSKDKAKSSISDFNKGMPKVLNSGNEHGETCSMKIVRSESESDPKSHASENFNLIRRDILDSSSAKSSKDEKVHTRRSDAKGQYSKDSKMESGLKLEEYDDSDSKLGALCSRDLNSASKQNPVKDFEGETKVEPLQKRLTSGTPKIFSHHGGESKQEGERHISLPEKASDKIPVHVYGNTNETKASNLVGNAVTKNSARQNSVNVCDVREVKDLKFLIPRKTDASSQTVSKVLKEAKDMRDCADLLKSHGFPLESNEAYFQAALKFLLGAFLESCNSEGGKLGEMNQIQAFNITANLCKCCALEYERQGEKAATALAYKCMEVAYWRVVYCKNSTSMREQTELQASLQMIPQGDSPSSSASDVDNLNNQAATDKPTVKGTVSHVAGNPICFARHHSNLLGLLDYSQYVFFALEASKKSQDAFSAANVVLGEAPRREFIDSVKKVMDFNFQDAEGFIRLVQLAMEAISRSKD